MIDIYNQFDFDNVFIDENPEVAVNVIMLKEVPTVAQLAIFEDVRSAFAGEKFAHVEPINANGDMTVSLESLALSPLNWLHDYLEQQKKPKTENAPKEASKFKNIKFFEFGPDQDKAISDNYQYLHCDNKPPPSESEKDQEKANLLKSRSEASLLERFISELSPKFRLKMGSIETSEVLKDDMFAGYCNHGGIISYYRLRDILFEDLYSNGQSDDLSLVRKNIATVEDEVFEDYVLSCPVVRCHGDYQQCWEDFQKEFVLD